MSLIGSVGVILQPFFNVSPLMEKIGVNALTLYAGTGKDDMNPFRPWKAGEQDNLQHITNDFYDLFVSVVTENRPKLNREKLIKEYGANVFPALQAEEYGYIDEYGLSYNDALKKLAAELGIKDDEYQVVQMESKNWVSQFLSGSSPVFTGTIKHQIQLTSELDTRLMDKFLYLYRPGT